MKISFNWLRELVTLPEGVGADDVARRLTMAGLEVEAIERRGRDIDGVRIAEVRGVRPHPQAEKLRIVRVSVGGAGPEEEVVCGAPNVPGPGGRVAWAAPGASLPGGLKLGRKEIRGFDSPGMLCSEKELGFGDAVDGILILSTDAPVGADLARYLAVADDVFEVNVTPNRADALSHAGIAREVAALYGVGWKFPALRAAAAATADESGGAGVTVEVRDPVACPRYQATVIGALRVGPSPLSMRLRLAACGVRSISNLVDVTNYVMLETGHPLHAFDLDQVNGGIVVRRAEPGETLRTLDGVDRKLEPDDVVIADQRRGLALGGVMGGATSEVKPSTTRVLLEAATFDPRAIRRTAKRLGLHSEASHRFERGVDAEGIPTAGARAASLLAALGGGRTVGAPVDRYPTPPSPRRVTLSMAALERVAGFTVAANAAADRLRSVAFTVDVAGGDLVATVPTFRPDVTIAEDLVEEVMRLVGYDRVPARLPAGGKAPEPSPERLADRLRDALAALGLHEIVSWAFIPRASLAALGDAVLADAIAVKNPISADYEVMRTSLLPGLVDAARRNLSRGVADFGLFEVGPVVRPAAGEQHHQQAEHAAGLLVGRTGGWLKPGEALDFFDLKRVVTEALAAAGVDEPRFVPLAASAAAVRDARPGQPGEKVLHPGVSAAIQAGDSLIGHLGELHPAVARRLGLEARGFVFELHLEALGSRGPAARIAPPPRFPAVTRDISFWIAAGTSAEAQRTTMQGAAEPLLAGLAVLEDFRDPRFVAEGEKGMLWTMTYRAKDRTLTDEEADAAHARVVAALSRAFPIRVR